jgi:hypothetical protein
MGRTRRRSRRPRSGHIVSAPSTTSIGLFSRDCSKIRISSIGAPHFTNLSSWKMRMKSSHFTILLNGVWPSPLVPFFGVFFTTTGLTSTSQPQFHLPYRDLYPFLRSLLTNRTPLGSFPLPLPSETTAHLQKSICCGGCRHPA